MALLYTSRVSDISFNLSGTEDVLADSYVNITSYDQFRDNKPFPGGVNDAHLGTTDHEYKCQTCFNSKRNCLGHEGHTQMNYPVWNPFGVAEGRKWLKLICLRCGACIIDITPYKNLPRDRRLDEASKAARASIKRECPKCHAIHPTIRRDNNELLRLVAEYHEDKRLTHKETLLPHKARDMLSRISDEDVIALGKNPRSHPRNFILDAVKVPPVTIRPDVRKMGGGRASNDDLTTLLQIIIKRNETMPTVIPAEIDAKLELGIFEMNNAYYDFVRSTVEGGMNSLASRIKGKQGQCRGNMSGKRITNGVRSTIACDNLMAPWEVGIPLIHVRTVQIREVCTPENYTKLLQYIQNGRSTYPGASKIIKRATGAEYDVGSNHVMLEVGDIIMRDIIDGDPVQFNRQPSLTASSLTCMQARVIMDPSIKTLLMNVLACVLFNADFDGDAMHLIINVDIAGRNEIIELSAVSNWFISHSSSSPSMGQVEDSVVGLAELTRSRTIFDKYHAMMLFQNTSMLPDFTDMKPGSVISGRDCLSKLLVDTPINYTRGSTWYRPDMAAYINYDPDEIKVVIDQGKIISGIVDKASIGKGANGGIYHIIANDYGAQAALDVMFNMQQMAIAYVMQLGYTIGINDITISPQAREEIDRISADIVNKSELITSRLRAGEIIPPIDKTVEQFYEEQQINTLNIFDDFTEAVLRAISPEVNNLFKIIMFGSKGTIEHMLNMVSLGGQKLVNGERGRQKFSFKRTLPYFPRFDTSPESRGYIANSYITGVNSYEYIFDAMAARYALITKQLSTSITGEANRKAIKNLETNIVNNFRHVTKEANIVQFAYGDDFLDARAVLRVKFPTVMMSDADFRTKYKHENFPAEFAEMERDRAKYRDIFMRIERMNIRELMTDERRMPVDVGRIVTDTLKTYPPTDKPDLNAAVAAVRDLCRDIPYVLTNEIQRAAGAIPPDYLTSACWLLCMLVRSYLHPIALATQLIGAELVKIIGDKIRLKYSQALIEPGTAVGILAAQSYSEPLTQYMLNSQHRGVAGSGTSKSGIKYMKEIFGARDVEQLNTPTMIIPIRPEFATTQAKVAEIANDIEMMRLAQFVTVWQIFFENFGAPVHSQYAAEAALIAEFQKLNPLLSPPGDLTKWCIRLQLNKTTMILKNMALELIIARLRRNPDLYVVYTPENAPEVIVRIYMRGVMFKSSVDLADVKKIKDELLNLIIRGVEGITSTRVVKLIRNNISADGAVVRADQWGVTTTGTNLRGVLSHYAVDTLNVQTNSIQETARVYGIEAARLKIVDDMRDILPVCNHRHYLMYADEMTYTGKVTAIESSGLRARENNNILLRAEYTAAIATLENAAINTVESKIGGITAPLLMGTVGKIGTLYNSYHMNADFIRANIKRPDSVIESLLEV